MPKANQKERQIQEINGQHQKRTIVRQQTHQNTNKWEISEEELEGPELGREQVCNLISDLLKKRGVQDQNPDVIGTALNKAQIDASKRHKNEGKQLPMKLRQNSELLLDQFAIIKIGQPGRGKSSKYKKIKTENAYDV